MPLEKLYYMTEICVGIAFVISILFLAMQIRQNTTLLKHSMSTRRRSTSAWLMRAIATDADFREFHRRIERDYENFSADEKYRHPHADIVKKWIGESESLLGDKKKSFIHYDGQNYVLENWRRSPTARAKRVILRLQSG